MTAAGEPRTYDEGLLVPLDPTSLTWARTWVRLWLRDRPEIESGGLPVALGQATRPRQATWHEFSRTDRELNAALSLDAMKSADGLSTYYRPHFTAARLYLGDPTLWKSRSVDGSSETRRDPNEIVGVWLAQGRAFDALIPLTPLPAFVEVEVGGSGGTVDAGPHRFAIPLEVGGL